ncbi:hypothetical protein MOBT1_000039 [Malassezia obtusa]|uniref:Uncharacterized protein n=1 Tax=Malassezia obtusa TaxID=76774 RepID=A0AAF0DXF9_9BASI|nr:hypothetical protein MOBT1_000039 [Malassezia obtusa]
MARSNVTFAILGVFVGYVLALPYVAALQSPSYSRVVVFGDSLVDNGNGTYKLSNRTWPADSAYFDGRFSNGLTWPEQLAGLLHVAHVDDYAHGSATTDNRVAKGCSGYNSTLPVPDVRTQVHRYLAHVGHADRDALYVVSGGSNDAFFGLLSGHTPKELAHDAVATLRRETERLQRHGARHVLVPTLSEMQATPYARKYSLGVARLITAAFTREVNHGLRAWVDGGARNVTLFDVHAVEALRA